MHSNKTDFKERLQWPNETGPSTDGLFGNAFPSKTNYPDLAQKKEVKRKSFMGRKLNQIIAKNLRLIVLRFLLTLSRRGSAISPFSILLFEKKNRRIEDKLEIAFLLA